MISDAMKNIVKKLKVRMSLSDMTALEFYAREGDWQTLDYSKEVAALHAWEIDSQFEANLRKNLPEAQVRIGDSYALARLDEFQNKFDFIVIDNPQNIFGGFCEHFEALPLTKGLAKKNKDIVVIFNINKTPFNYESQTAWQSRRSEYYGTDASNLSLDFLQKFYAKKMSELGFEVRENFYEARHPDYLYYFVFVLRH